MRIISTLFLLGIATCAIAQNGEQPSKLQRAQQAKADLEQRFSSADSDGDGKLTRAEAEQKMPRVFQAFDEIDSARNGYLTLEQVQKFARGKIAERRKTSGG